MSEAGWGVRGVTVRYGDRVVLDEVDFDVPRGQVSMVVGGDGAGKTTLLRCLVGAVRVARGTVSAPRRRDCGFMPTGAAGVWQNLTVHENIAFVAAAYGLPGAAAHTRRDELLAAAGLDAVGARLAGELSGGMRQKLSFCLAILHHPQLLVLDEPSTGVDPVSRIELWRLIAAAAVDGTAVAMATTYLDEAERASSVLVLDSGRALARGVPQELIDTTPGTITAGEGPAANRDMSWRRGRTTHSWHAGPPAAGEVPIAADMEDSVIALTLADRSTRQGRR